MFAKIAGFEFRYQLRQPIFWIATAIFALLAFGLVGTELTEARSCEHIRIPRRAEARIEKIERGEDGDFKQEDRDKAAGEEFADDQNFAAHGN